MANHLTAAPTTSWYESPNVQIPAIVLTTGATMFAVLPPLATYAKGIAYNYVYVPIEQTSRQILNCDPNDPSRKSQCLQADIAHVACCLPIALCFTRWIVAPICELVMDKAVACSKALVQRSVKIAVERRQQKFLNLITESFRIYMNTSEELRNRPDELQSLDDESRTSLLQIASEVGDVALIRVVLHSPRPNEARLKAIVDNITICPMCHVSFDDSTGDSVVARACHDQHCIHYHCLLAWNQTGRQSCLYCENVKKTEVKKLFEYLEPVSPAAAEAEPTQTLDKI